LLRFGVGLEVPRRSGVLQAAAGRWSAPLADWDGRPIHGLGADAHPRIPSGFPILGDCGYADGLRRSPAAGALPTAGNPPDIELHVYDV
jgi:hypothetical protein